MRLHRIWAERRRLNPSETVYVAWTRDRHRLRFSKSGDPTFERVYRTHWVSPEFRKAKRHRLAERQGYSAEDRHERRDHVDRPQWEVAPDHG